MHTLVDGKASELISVYDRGFQYGDGCFETIRVIDSKPVLLQQHLSRLEKTCHLLKIPVDLHLIEVELALLISNNSPQGIAKIIVTRGSGGCGYAPPSSNVACRVVQFHSIDDAQLVKNQLGINVQLCEHRLSQSAGLAGMKHLNRLDQVIASHEIATEFEEGLCLDQNGKVIEGTRSNLLLSLGGTIITPDLSLAGVQGIMLNFLLDKFKQAGQQIDCCEVDIEDLERADELLLCNSVFGVWPVLKMHRNDNVIEWSIGPMIEQARLYQNEIFHSAN